MNLISYCESSLQNRAVVFPKVLVVLVKFKTNDIFVPSEAHEKSAQVVSV